MKRIYFLLPDAPAAEQLVNEFRGRGFSDSEMHLVASNSAKLENVPEADPVEQSDLGPALKRGTAIGGTTGLLAGLVAVSIPTGGLALGGGALLAITAAGTGVGTFAAALVGAGMSDKEVADCEQAIKNGRILMMLDVPDDQVDEYRSLVQRQHPEVDVRDTVTKNPSPPA
ncbi:MAG: DUF1269 domain-containing protein [Ectothiorhodospiraceae bacterium]|nr:DUF1269 domain-containing protein [Ectothiorhodospiraceae bacterium]MCH8503236.1 DUF1269 domain-containing protein [Ectothiorhodospiraceae bacterium]